ncbi:hypothetical protein SporoP8_13925 [Sporosarcina ureae]|uniref:hypothetical protein n=1 Tax=Sporosarcina ureae TaxID=1571 RepID=UPI000A16B64B|nr:hypothetical protein [Sporosarcina ureae]ARJ39878.1 hypothetical protein SporoP8_13925 [Sporosarcina ureae]
MEKVKVIDAIMGAGKTTKAFEIIEKADAGEKFIYITPFLAEIERIKTTITSRAFAEPTNRVAGGRKMDSLKRLIENGEDIAATHSLFEMADDELIEMIQTSGYTLILDEVMDVIDKATVSPADMRILLEKKFIAIENNAVKWVAPAAEYEYGRFDDVKLLAQAGNLYYHRNTYLVWAFPPQVFEAFNEVYVLTYLFRAQIQRYYFDLYKIPYEVLSIKDGEIIPHDVRADNRAELRALIDLYEGEHNRHGERSNFSFSKGWMGRRSDDEMQAIQRSIYTYVRRIADAKSGEVLWTTLKDFETDLKGRGYSKGFLPVNMRATNEYAERSVLIYAYSRFMNPIEKSFFQDNGVKVDEELLAVSEMLQWIWRSRIRNAQPIKLYLPAERMRRLLTAWANYEI